MQMLLPPLILMSPRLFVIRGQYGKDFLASPRHVISLSVFLCPIPPPSLGNTDVKATLNYTVNGLFTSDAKLRRLVMGKRCMCLQGTEGKRNRK